MSTTLHRFFARSELTATIYLFKRELVIVAVLSMVANVLMLAPTLYMLQVFDRVLVSQSELTLLALSAITLFLFVMMAFAEWMRSRVLINAGIRLDDRLSTRVFASGFNARLKQAPGAPTNAVGDLMELRQFLTGNGVFAFFDLPWVPVYIGVLYVLHPWLGISAVVFALIQAALAWWAHWQTTKPSETANHAAAQDQDYLQGKLRNADTLESMGMVQNLIHHWRAHHYNYLVLGSHAQAVTHRVTAVSKFVRYTQQSLALGLGGLLVIKGQISPGAMIAANVLTSRALSPIDMMVGIWRSFLSAREAFLRLESLFAKHPWQSKPPIGQLPGTGVQLVNVVASAAGRPSPILKNVTLDMAPGSMTVVMGPSGSGKSTLARVIVGIWPDVTGLVLLGGTPIQNWDRMEIGPHIGYLPQDIELFEGTIAQNIARFNQLDSAKIIEAAISTGLHEMILRFPKGYDTPIGEAGGLLSGGQRQRIGLARAVYGKPALVVLDEPNANLDDAGEAALMHTVIGLKNEGRTIVLITHRPASMASTDQLVVMEDGRIKAAGFRDAVVLALQQEKQAAALPPGTTHTDPAAP
jgi:ATP-binding cassette subfamily C exporter for protease/lipase